MNRFLLIDADTTGAQRLGLACVERGVAVSLAENLCEAVRVLLSTNASLIVVDLSVLRLTPGEHADLFERVAPGVPVVIGAHADTPLEVRAAFEVLGFRVLTRPVTVEDLLEKVLG